MVGLLLSPHILSRTVTKVNRVLRDESGQQCSGAPPSLRSFVRRAGDYLCRLLSRIEFPCNLPHELHIVTDGACRTVLSCRRFLVEVVGNKKMRQGTFEGRKYSFPLVFRKVHIHAGSIAEVICVLLRHNPSESDRKSTRLNSSHR